MRFHPHPLHGTPLNEPLLTLAIPTYNRCTTLDPCLVAMLPQVVAHAPLVELLISDNASTDDTPTLIARHQAAGAPLRVIRNPTNIGPDANFAQCIREAKGKFVLVFGDDDVLLEGALDKLLAVLKQGDPGVVFIRSYAFKDDFRKERPRKPPRQRVLRFTNPRAFAAKVNILFTFISGNVINKHCLPQDFNPGAYLDTNLVQLSWTLKAAQRAKENVVLDDFLVAAKSDNSGGYAFCQVFGVNMNRIFQVLEAEGDDPGFFQAIRRRTLSGFFPRWILNLRIKGESFKQEDHFKTLGPIYRGYSAYWLMVWPAAKWPLFLAKPWIRLCRHWVKLLQLF